MKKILLGFLLIGGLAVGLTACGVAAVKPPTADASSSASVSAAGQSLGVPAPLPNVLTPVDVSTLVTRRTYYHLVALSGTVPPNAAEIERGANLQHELYNDLWDARNLQSLGQPFYNGETVDTAITRLTAQYTAAQDAYQQLVNTAKSAGYDFTLEWVN